MTVRVKICGITTLTDALAAVDAGADALGFIFFEGSPRYIAPSVALEIINKIPPFVTKVGVFVDEASERVKNIIRDCGLNVVQLHGTETRSFCSVFPIPVIKAFRIKDPDSLKIIPEYPVAAYLLDSYVAGQLGGTGAKFNWDLAIEAKTFGRPIVLAGGLTPENVMEAVGSVRPYGIDVSSGVESKPGQKDHKKLREFIQRAKS